MTRSKAAIWASYGLSGIVVLFLLMDGAMKVSRLPQVDEAMLQLGYPAGLEVGLGIVILAIAALYAMPRTSILGAILLTGLLGGAMATHLRVGSPLFSHFLFGLYVGAMAWGGLYLRDERLRALLPLAQRARAS